MDHYHSRLARARWHTLVFMLLLVIVLASAHPASAAIVNRKLSGDLVAGGDLIQDQWFLSPNGQTVVFAADKLTNDKTELFSVSSAGSTPVRISGTLAAGDDVVSPVIANDEWVVFGVTPAGSAKITRLYAARLDASPPLPLAPDLGTYGYIKNFIVSPDGQYVAYVVDDSLSLTETDQILYVANLAGEWWELSTCDLSGPCYISEVTFTPNSAKLVYYDTKAGTSPFLYAVSLPNGDPVSLIGNIMDFQLTPDSLFAIGRTYLSNLLKISLDGSGVVDLAYTNESTLDLYAVNADSTQLIYTYGGANEVLRSVPLSGGTPVTISGTIVTGGNVTDFKLTPDGQTVIFRGDLRTDECFELFGVGIDGTPARVRLSGEVMLGDVQEDYQITSDSLSVVYRADQDIAGQIELFLRISGSAAPVKISNVMLTAGSNVDDFMIFPDGLSVAYLADREMDARSELYGWTVIGGGAHFKLNSPLIGGGDVYEFAILPDSSGVVYLADQQVDNRVELWITQSMNVCYIPLVKK